MNEKGFFNPLKLFGGKKKPEAEPGKAASPASAASAVPLQAAPAVSQEQIQQRLNTMLAQQPEFFGSTQKTLGPGFSGKSPEEKHGIVSQALENKRAGLEALEKEHDTHEKAVALAHTEGEHEDSEKIERTLGAIRELLEAERKREQELLNELETLLNKHPQLAGRVAAERLGGNQASGSAAEEPAAILPRSKLERMLAEHPKMPEEQLREAEQKVRAAAQIYNVEPEPLSKAERKKVLEELHTLPPGQDLAEKAEKVAEKAEEPAAAPLTVSYHPQPTGESTEDESIDFKELVNLKAKKDEVQAVYKDIEKHKIVTDFDKILTYLRTHKKAKIAEMATSLNIDRNRILENLKTLEDSRLIEIVYPPIGAPIVVYKEAKAEGEK